MTENEAIKTLKIMLANNSIGMENKQEVLEAAIQALEEIQQYRAIGTVKQFEWCKDASHWKELFKDKLEQYEAIGTVEEFKAFRSDDFTQDLLNMGYTKGIRDGYNKAINDCKTYIGLHRRYAEHSIDDYVNYLQMASWLNSKIAEQLKAGGKNG